MRAFCLNDSTFARAFPAIPIGFFDGRLVLVTLPAYGLDIRKPVKLLRVAESLQHGPQYGLAIGLFWPLRPEGHVRASLTRSEEYQGRGHCTPRVAAAYTCVPQKHRPAWARRAIGRLSVLELWWFATV